MLVKKTTETSRAGSNPVPVIVMRESGVAEDGLIEVIVIGTGVGIAIRMYGLPRPRVNTAATRMLTPRTSSKCNHHTSLISRSSPR